MSQQVMSQFDYDLFVIGAGSGGVRAARIAASHGARVAIAEEFRVGGTCVIRGCVPKKLYVLASRFADEFDEAKGFGWQTGQVDFSWPALVEAKNREISRLEKAYAANLEKSAVTSLALRAELTTPQMVTLADGRSISAKKILIATGGQPEMPDVPGTELAISSNEIFDLPELPRSVAIIGGGYIAVEFACLLQRLGARVTVIYRGEAVLRGFDNDVRAAVSEAMLRAGIQLMVRAQIARIEMAGQGRRITLNDGQTIEADVVLAATGRKPYTRGLGLEKVGVRLDNAGAIIVDSQSRTSVPSIWAVGDVTNRVCLTPVAIREGHAFADTEFGGRAWEADHTLVPSAVFSTPEIGTVGLSEEQAHARHGNAIAVYMTSFRSMKATLSGSSDKVLMKLVVERNSDKVVGVHIVGEGAAEMAQLLAISIRMGATKADFDATMPLHPTAAEELVTLRTPVR